MILVSYHYDKKQGLWVVEGSKYDSNKKWIATRIFATFKTEKGAFNYCTKYQNKKAE